MTARSHVYPTYKRFTAGTVLAIVVLWVGYVLLWPHSGTAASGAGVPIGSPAPDFELKTIDGKTYKLSDLKGKPVLINFFATWCPSCQEEMPTLQEAYRQYESQGFVLLAVDLGESSVAIRSFQEKLGLTFPIVVDENDRVTKLYDIIPLPTSYFLDKKGIVQGKWTGAINKVQLEALLKKIL